MITTLYLHTAPDAYVEWLQNLTKQVHDHPAMLNVESCLLCDQPRLLMPDKRGAPIVIEVCDAPASLPSAGNTLVPLDQPGRVIIDIVPLAPEDIEVTITPTCDRPDVIAYYEKVKEETLQHWPHVAVKKIQPGNSSVLSLTKGRRGGPIGTPEDEKLKIIRGWVRVEGRINQEVYAHTHGISTATLRRWMRDMREAGKL